MDLTSQLKAAASEAGADLVGVADLAPFKTEPPVAHQANLEGFSRAVSVAVRLDDVILDGIERAPTPEYARHYRAANMALDAITAQIAKWTARQGFSALAVPASRSVDEVNWLGHISHKAVARMAGIGWQGKSLLIVSPRHGPRIRLATLLTDMPLSADRPLKNRCGRCSRCAEACPVLAIKNIKTQDRYARREDALWLDRCVDYTQHFKTVTGIGAQVCGVCVRVCPFGRRRNVRLGDGV